MKRISLLLLLSLSILSSGCLWHKKPANESHIYGGDAPNIKFTPRQERAGGKLRTF